MVSAATVSVAAERAAHVEQALEQLMCSRPTLPSYHPYTLQALEQRMCSAPTLPSYHPCTLQALEQLMFSEPGLHTLVLMDLRMDVMDGFSAAMAIKKMGMDVPIIAVTADGRSALLRRRSPDPNSQTQLQTQP